MTVYPKDFHRRLEQKWARRAGVSSESPPPAVRAKGGATCANRSKPVFCLGRTALVTERGLPPAEQREDILARTPWLLAIGQWLQAEYSAVEQPVPERLAALLKQA